MVTLTPIVVTAPKKQRSGFVVYDPACTVTLFKLIKRKDGVAQRYAGARRQIDLTPFLGDGGSVRTSKGLNEGGGFTLSFPDQPDHQVQDSVYALVEPMDMVEIRMSRSPQNYAGAKLPLIMRGFVSTSSRTETMGADGTPQRFLVISGMDFTKLWMIFAVYWAALYVTDPDLLTLWNVGASIGMAPVTYTANAFVIGMVNVMNKKVAGLAAFNSAAVLPFSVAASVPEGEITPNLLSAAGEGNYWSIMTAFCDKPWNEIFVQDQEAGPQVVFRPVPYKNISGNFIMPGAADPGTIQMDDSQVISLAVSRSDDQVGNIFSVNSDPSNLLSGGAVMLAALADGNTFEQGHNNNDPTLYGMKVMAATTNMVQSLPAGAGSPTDSQGNDSATVNWWVNRYSQLRDLNEDNSAWESGSATVQGVETLKAGMYWQLTRGSLVSSFYLTQVDHTFVPFQGWTSDLTLVRGDGFIVRDKYTGSPFWAEGRNGL